MTDTLAAPRIEAARRLWTPDRLADWMDPKFVRFRHSVLMGNQYRRMTLGLDPWQIWAFQPQIGKSEIASRRGPLWHLNLFPHERIGLASYAARLSTKSSRWVRNAIRTSTDRLSVRLDPTRQTQAEFGTSEGGGMIAVGVGGSITGDPLDAVIIDDAHKNWFEAHSAAQRDRVWEWWGGDIMTRLQDQPTPARGLVVATRWHPDDLTGRLLEQNIAPDGRPWTVLHVPAIADATLTPAGDPLGRADGEVVEPRRFRRSTMIERRAAAGPFIWQALYQGDPRVAEGTILRREWFSWTPAMPRRTNVMLYATSWDCTFTDTEDGSFVVGQAWALTRDKPHRFVIYDQIRGRFNFPDTRRQFESFAQAHPEATVHLIEKAANGPALAAELAARGTRGIVQVPATVSKESRAVQVSPLVADGRVDLPGWFGPGSWVDGMIDEVTDFPHGTHDDQLDALTQAIVWLDRHAGGQGRAVTVDDERLFGRR